MLDPKKYIAEYGGKAGGYFYLRDLGGFEKNLVPMLAFLGRDEKFSGIADRFPDNFNPVIVRGSHPNDYWGLVDIIETAKGKVSKNDLKDAISWIRGMAKHPSVLSYNEYEREFYKDKDEWQEYDGKIGIMVQRFIDGPRGSIVEHPHKRGAYLIDTVTAWGGITNIDEVIVDDGRLDCSTAFSKISKDGTLMAQVVSLYKKVRETGFIPEDYSFQMEFGFDETGKIYFYQARPFKRFQEPTFRLSSRRGTKNYECFGITPEKGLELRIIKTKADPEDVQNIDHPFALVLDVYGVSLSDHYIQNPNFQPRNMAVFLPVGGSRPNLEHGTYRWVTKAEVSILSREATDISVLSQEIKYFFKELDTGSVIRVISDGLNHEIERV